VQGPEVVLRTQEDPDLIGHKVGDAFGAHIGVGTGSHSSALRRQPSNAGRCCKGLARPRTGEQEKVPFGRYDLGLLLGELQGRRLFRPGGLATGAVVPSAIRPVRRLSLAGLGLATRLRWMRIFGYPLDRLS
jgi:hypothetical protein